MRVPNRSWVIAITMEQVFGKIRSLLSCGTGKLPSRGMHMRNILLLSAIITVMALGKIRRVLVFGIEKPLRREMRLQSQI